MKTMIKQKRYVVFLLFLVIWIGNYPVKADGEKAIADEPTTEQTAADALTQKCKNRFVGAPLVYYTPETHLSFGGAFSYILRIAGCDKKTRPSSISPLVIYTQLKQFKAELKTDLYFKDNRYHLESKIKTQKYPDKFFGIGNSTLKDDEESYTLKDNELDIAFSKAIGKGFNIGLEYRFADWRIVNKKEGGLLDSGGFIGSNKGTLSGLSVFVNHDTRDNIYYPMQGDYIVLDALVYPAFLGSTYKFATFSLDVRKYATLFKTHVAAVQVLVKIQTGTVPFTELARMGGQNLMRGYFDGRFRDKNLMAVQAEYRMPLFWRFGLVGFAGAGNVSPKIDRSLHKDIKASYGFGLRFLFDKKEKIQVRFDYGMGKGTSGFYASIFEAF